MSAALGLYRLQQVDSQMDQIRSRLEVIRETLENDVELRNAREALSNAESMQKQADSTLKQSEAEVEKQSIKIEQTEASLYSGTVKNPKELQDLQMDVASLKKYLGTLEERELEAMIQAEETGNALQKARHTLEGVQSRLDDQHHDLTTEREALNRDLDRLEAERRAVTGDLPGQELRLYEQLRLQKRGVAVARLNENACSACGTTLTASQQQNARMAAQFFHCPTCGRIIYSG